MLAARYTIKKVASPVPDPLRIEAHPKIVKHRAKFKREMRRERFILSLNGCDTSVIRKIIDVTRGRHMETSQDVSPLKPPCSYSAVITCRLFRGDSFGMSGNAL
jgi:hypothetical protein